MFRESTWDRIETMRRAAVSVMQFYRVIPGDIGDPDAPSDHPDPAWAIVSLGQALLKRFHDKSKPESQRCHHARLVGRDGITKVEIMVDEDGKIQHVLTSQMRGESPGGAAC